MKLHLGSIFKNNNKEDKKLKKALVNLLGFSPSYLAYYITALTHRSSASASDLNNERLEFLGDAYIGSIVGEYLFKKYPTANEGFLTEMRSKIVSRQSLNSVALKMGLQKLVRYNKQDKVLNRSHIFGNAFEALVGAIYLDKGFKTTKQFIVSKLIGTFLDVDELEQTEYNFKNKLYTWAQKNNYQLEFDILNESKEAGRKVFNIGICVNGNLFVEATGYSKKEASQTAAQKALEILEEQPDITFPDIAIEEEQKETSSESTDNQPSEAVQQTYSILTYNTTIQELENSDEDAPYYQEPEKTADTQSLQNEDQPTDKQDNNLQ